MKKILSLLLVLLLLSSCSKTIDNDVAISDSKDDTPVTEAIVQQDDQQQFTDSSENAATIGNNEHTETDYQSGIETTITEQQTDTQKDTENTDIAISGTITNYNVANYASLDDLWEEADYVVIASPTQSYDKSTQHWLDGFNVATDFSNASLDYSYSVRPFKVNKVYKGENMKLKEIQVCEHVLEKDREVRVMEGSYPTEQGTKYILFLFRANTEEEQYFPLLYQGKYSLNDSENKEQKNISQDMYKQVKEKFKDEIK